MTSMKSELRKKAIELRKEGFSYSQIQEKIDVAKSTLSYWLRDYPLDEERIKALQEEGSKKGQVKAEKYRRTMRKKREKLEKSIYGKYKNRFSELSKDEYFVAGLMLYLGEGGKTHNYRIGLTNTNPKIIKFFIKWLEEFFSANRDDLRVQLHLYEDMNIEKEVKYWSNHLNLDLNQFYNPSIRELKEGSFSYPESHRHGTCALYLMDTRKKTELMMAIEALLDNFMGT